MLDNKATSGNEPSEFGDIVTIDAPSSILISFIVIAYNEARNITQSLSAIRALEGLGDHEIIVVNDGSQDCTARIVVEASERNPKIRLIDLVENRGRGTARSLGIEAARGSLIATVDADIILPRDWLMRAWANLQHYHAVGGTAVPDGDVAYLYKKLRLSPRHVRHTTAVTGSNALYRRKVFEIVGFDPSLREGEDVALNHAIRHCGLTSATVPGLLVRHEEDKTLGTSLKWMFDSGRGATRQLLTYRQVRLPDLAAAGFAGAISSALYLGSRGHRLIGPAIPFGFILAASAQHVLTRFEAPRNRWRDLASAIAVDGVFLSVYFTGRAAGLTLCGEVRSKLNSRRETARSGNQ